MVRIAGASLPVTKDILKNSEGIHRAIEFAARAGADILLTPEGSLSGYTHDFNQALTEKELARITLKASEIGLAMALGTCFKEDDGKVYNQIRLYEKDGSYVGFHAKYLRCGTMSQPTSGEINEYAEKEPEVFQLCGMTVGCLICNDLWANPMCTPMPDSHLTQKLSDMGAKIILHAVNGGRGDDEWRTVVRNYHESNLRMRAKAGNLWIVTVDSSFPETLPTSSPCGVIAPDGSWAHKVNGHGEQMFTYAIDLSSSLEN